jgi:hypothetical protein
VTAITPTDEQQAVIDMSQTGETFVTDACAGSGKTTVLRMAAERMPAKKILYLVYNRAAKEDAERVFPGNVEVRTIHSLTWRAFGQQYGERMRPGSPRVTARQTAVLLGITQPLEISDKICLPPTVIARMAMDAVDNYAYDSVRGLQLKHVRFAPGAFDPAQAHYLSETVLSWARKLWDEARQPGSPHRFTYEYGWKLYVLGGGKIGHDLIMLDEAQDSNSITETFIKSQNCPAIVVGDSCQQLYRWRGADDILERFDGTRLTLSQSWRFGQEVADEANKWLPHAEGPYRVKGNPAIRSLVTTGDASNPKAILCRTNAGAMGEAIQQMQQGKRVAITGNLREQIRNLAEAIGELKSGRVTTHPELVGFASWEELRSYTREPGGGDLKPLVSLIQEYQVPGVLAACDALVEEKPKPWEPRPDVVVSTGHKAKGREWGSVRIGEDFEPPAEVEDPVTGKMGPGPISRADAMLGYVCVTRARDHLDRSGLAWIDDHPAVERPAKMLT